MPSDRDVMDGCCARGVVVRRRAREGAFSAFSSRKLPDGSQRAADDDVRRAGRGGTFLPSVALTFTFVGAVNWFTIRWKRSVRIVQKSLETV